ncbi:hypothetical protein CH298_13415 [Rhodococcoides fascians]|uniref:hypothetical protein n=1 Tax=Nocardiaceae TaxID=85025 RepID=UPI000B9B3373|nr:MULTISPECIES: hypothetical protein [Rhodococcus]OZD03882.1 hypothetical protein CH275_15950 [Rhodococcus sp. 06-235-1A]OZE89976.1 hypothetical protein CH303_13295 [Rhodococcus fascians]OZF18283.1 hypothetical protein CH298_13415 [Rhodococcus fascians]OZF21734.1 hypothetical protein CH297_13310 [Rhodococcus fascians]OZF67359.1 hypothetical protein CH308_13210 [Rhodococcus fascians]
MGRFRHPITVVAYEPVVTGRNAHGGEIVGYPVGEDIEDCAFAPLPQSEESLEQFRDKVIDYGHLWGPFDARIERRWKVDVPGYGSFIVSDQVERWKNPHNGREPGFEAHLKDVEG